MKLIWLLALASIFVIVLSACSSSSPSTSIPPSSSASPSTTSEVTTPAGGGQTFAQAAAAGKTTYSNRCARCHGDSGQGGTGPALIGSGSKLARYGTSQGLLNYVKATMPKDAPGSLSSQDYSNILAYLMVQNNYLSASAAFDVNAFLNIQLK